MLHSFSLLPTFTTRHSLPLLSITGGCVFTYLHVGAQGNTHIHICKCSPIEKCPKQSPVALIMPPVIDNIHMDTILVSQDKTISTNTHDKLTIQDFSILLAHIGVPVLHFSEF